MAILLLFVAAPLCGQAPFFSVWEPGASLTHRFDRRWSANLSFTASYRADDFRDEVSTKGWQHLETQSFVTYKLLNQQALSFGYLFRKEFPFDTVGYEHRLMGQYTFLWELGAYRVSNRLRLERRIRDGADFNRLRYRLGLDFPLQGEAIDAGEAYLVVKQGLLYSFNKHSDLLQSRSSLALGWQLQARQKIEVGLEYQFSGSSRPMTLVLQSSFYQLL